MDGDDDLNRTEIAEILVDMLSTSAERTLTQLLDSGELTGDIGDRNLQSLEFSGLAYAVNFYRSNSDEIKEYGPLSLEARFLLNICSAVVDARQSFIESNFSKGRNAIATLKELSEEYALPDKLELELNQMEIELSYLECMAKMKAALTAEEPVQYLISAVKSRKRTVSSGRVTNASILSTSPAASVNFSPPNEGEELLADEDFMLNETALDTRELEKILQYVSQVQDILESEELPETFFHHISALEALKQLRNDVKNYNWNSAIETLNIIARDNLIELVPSIKIEIESVTEIIKNIAVITLCKIALMKGQPTGSIGLADFENLSLDLLEEASKLGETIGCTSERAIELHKGTQEILKLRYAQKEGNWENIRLALKHAESIGIGNGHTSICLGELNRGTMERDNHDYVESLKEALIKEVLPVRESLLDLDHASVNELTTVYTKATTFPEDTRGPVLKTLMSLAEVVLKLRRAAIQKQWFLVESLTPVVKDYIESFQNDIEKSDRVISQRKTISYRASAVFRGSILAARSSSGGNSSGSMLVGGSNPESPLLMSPAGSPHIGVRPAVWEKFTILTTTIKRELHAIDNHFIILKLEIDLIQLLKQDGIQSEVIGTIDLTNIKTDNLIESLQLLKTLEEEGLILPENLIKLGKIANLVIEIRKAVLANKWDSLSTHLEETLHGNLGILPEYTRNEILIIRRELENRWIITNLTNAIQTGKLEGELGNTNLKNISCEHLISYITTVKSLNPRTEFALLLLYTTECIYPLRKLLCHENIDWIEVNKLVKKLINDVQRQKIHVSVLQELKLIQATAEDTLLCNTMYSALSTGSVTGQPGELNIDTINIQVLEVANKVVARSVLKTERANQLAQACKAMERLREALLRLHTTEDPYNIWTTVQSILAAIEDTRQNQTSTAAVSMGWEVCNEEIELITRHVHIEEVRSRLLDCAVRTSHVYAERKDSLAMPSIGSSSNTSGGDSGEGSGEGSGSDNKEESTSTTTTAVISTDAVQTDRAGLYCSELDSIIEYAKNLTFESEYLERYIGCATTLRLLRNHIVKHNWTIIEDLLSDHSVRNNLKILYEAEQELAWIACELHNHRAIEIILKSLKDSSCIPTNHNIITYNNNDINHILNINDFSINNNILEDALIEIKKYKLTSKIAVQLSECCKHILQLRINLKNHCNNNNNTTNNNTSSSTNSNKLIEESLKWFQNNYSICPSYILIETQQIYVIYQNELLFKNLSSALLIGKALGPCGELNIENIYYKHLEILLNQAETIQPRFIYVEELLEAAAVAISIRQALLSYDLTQLSSIISEISEQDDQFHLLIVDEIATARGEIDNSITVNALLESLKSFDDTESKAMEMTFMNNTTNTTTGGANSGNTSSSSSSNDTNTTLLDLSNNNNTEDKSASRPGYSILQTFSQRRYSFANMNNTNIDLETIDIDILDQGLRIAEDHGVYSKHARILYRTVHLVRTLRIAMKSSDWSKLEEILNNTNFDENIHSKYDIVALKEIQALKSQLKMRESIVDLSKALKIGWARCSKGIVDASGLQNDYLENAIDRANRSILELQSNHLHEENEHEKTENENSDEDNENETILVVEKEEGATNTTTNTTTNTSTAPAMDVSLQDTSKRRVSFVSDEDNSSPSNNTITTNNNNTTSTSNSSNDNNSSSSPSLVQKQVDLLMSSARTILHIREILLSGDITKAGILAEETLNNNTNIHYSIVDELKLYSKEIHIALSMFTIYNQLKECINEGNIHNLENIINIAKNSNIFYNDDLGFIRMIDRAEHVYYILLNIKKSITELSNVYNINKLKEIIQQAIKYNMSNKELIRIKNRVEKLLAYELLINEITASNYGILTSQNNLEIILKYSKQLNLINHPITKIIKLKLKLKKESFRTIIISESIYKYNIFILATETIILKRLYLLLPSSIIKYNLLNFPNLRNIHDYSVRMNIKSEDLKRTMLTHSNQPLPTSLTKLSPILSALSIIIYIKYIRTIEKNIYTNNNIILKQLLILGRKHPVMRDEILLLIIKQMRNNMDIHAVIRLWKCLTACLYHFPPSHLFESYLELYLLQQCNIENNSIYYIQYAQKSIRYMHSSIILYGYNKIIKKEFKDSLFEMEKWFVEDSIYDPTIVEETEDMHVNAIQNNKIIKNKSNIIEKKERIDPAFSSSSTIVVVDKKASTGGNNNNSSSNTTTSSTNKNTSSTSSNNNNNNSTTIATTSTTTTTTIEILRGTREDWISRFRGFNYDSSIKEGGYMTKHKFTAAIATSITLDTCIDQFDRDIFYFLLFGKNILNYNSILREYNTSNILFHSNNEDEINASIERKIWLDMNIPIIDKSSELFFSQLKAPDLALYAERFWDSIIEKMSIECLYFPFLKWEGDPHRKPSIANSGSDVTINWEIYREILLIGMKKYIERSKIVRTIEANSSIQEDYKLTGFSMNHI